MTARRRPLRKSASRSTKRTLPQPKTVRKAARSAAVKVGVKKRVKKATSQWIDVVFKWRAMAQEPPRDNNPAHLDRSFRAKLDLALQDLAAQGKPFRFVEGFRTIDRQQWLYGSGRPNAVPYGRAGKIVTYKNGTTNRSNHQGNGTAGSGKAADCYPLRDGKVYTPPASDPIWKAYADAVIRQGLRAGLNFPTLKDAPQGLGRRVSCCAHRPARDVRAASKVIYLSTSTLVCRAGSVVHLRKSSNSGPSLSPCAVPNP